MSASMEKKYKLRRKYILASNVKAVKAKNRHQHLYALLDPHDKIDFEELLYLQIKGRRSKTFPDAPIRTVVYFLTLYGIFLGISLFWQANLIVFGVARPIYILLFSVFLALRVHFNPNTLYYYTWIQFLQIKDYDFRTYVQTLSRMTKWTQRIPTYEYIFDYIVTTTNYGLSSTKSSILHN